MPTPSLPVLDSTAAAIDVGSEQLHVSIAGLDGHFPDAIDAPRLPAVAYYDWSTPIDLGASLPCRITVNLTSTVVDVFEAVGKFAAGTMDAGRLHDLEGVACPSAGSCGGQFTANTMACVGEAIGLSMPNSNMAPAPYKSREEVAMAAGRAVMRPNATSRTWLRPCVRPRASMLGE